jgi:2-oxoglutarate/2-oxoacid ferredoxin oxidoreductase subunit beta
LPQSQNSFSEQQSQKARINSFKKINMSYTAKEFANTNEVRWCPGCGDHAILKHFQSALAKSGIAPHKTAVVSGIGCASRLPYYMSTYGFHTIHGRAFPIATGLKYARPDMNVWVITGDGDSLSIGGNHYIHLFRRDIDLSILLFNNQIYGLTKGQYSPSSTLGQYSKTSPKGNIEKPLNALELALVSGSTFVARTFDRDASFIQTYMVAAQNHKGTSLVEILQNCPIFNDAIFDPIIDKKNQENAILRLEENQPLLFGEHKSLTIVLEGLNPVIKPIDTIEKNQVWIHDPKNKMKAMLLANLGYGDFASFPVAMGVLYASPKETELRPKQNYEAVLENLLQK